MFAPKEVLVTKISAGGFSLVVPPEPLGADVPRLEWMTFNFMNMELSSNSFTSGASALLDRYRFLRRTRRNRVHVEIQGIPSPNPEATWQYNGPPVANDGSWIFLQEETGDYTGVPELLAPPDPQVIALIDTYKPLNAAYFTNRSDGANFSRRIPAYKARVEQWGGKFATYSLFGPRVGDPGGGRYPLWNQYFNGCAWPDRDVVGNKTSDLSEIIDNNFPFQP